MRTLTGHRPAGHKPRHWLSLPPRRDANERQNRSEDQREVPRVPAEVEARWRLLGLSKL
jgi:hypothetical protein